MGCASGVPGRAVQQSPGRGSRVPALGQAPEGSEEYGGPRPFSEPETRIVRLIGQATRPQAFVNLHSGEYAVYVPWDSQRGLAPGLPPDVGEVLEKVDAYCQCMHGAAGEVAGCAPRTRPP